MRLTEGEAHLVHRLGQPAHLDGAGARDRRLQVALPDAPRRTRQPQQRARRQRAQRGRECGAGQQRDGERLGDRPFDGAGAEQ